MDTCCGLGTVGRPPAPRFSRAAPPPAPRRAPRPAHGPGPRPSRARSRSAGQKSRRRRARGVAGGRSRHRPPKPDGQRGNVCPLPLRLLRTGSPARLRGDAEPSSTSALGGQAGCLLLVPRSAPAAGPAPPARPPSTPPRRPPTRRARKRDGGVWAARSSAIHFRGRPIRRVRCYTLLGGCRPPWPPPRCRDGPTPFLGSVRARLAP